MTTITRQLAEFAADLEYDTLPDDVITRTKMLIFDVTGVIVRARNDAESTPSLISAMERLGLAAGDCSVLGDKQAYAPSAAAMVNGTLAHSLDFDDTHAAGSLHSSAPIVPAALAAAEMAGASGKDLIAACVAGYEIQIRLALALDPTDHYARGFHPTATCGVFGAAAAAGRLLGMDADGIQSAFGIALSQAAGSMQFLADGSWTKRSHVGQAASNGLICATMAAEGFKGPDAAFEGQWGFLQGYAPNSDEAKATDRLGSHWETLRLAVKPYPSCRYSHAAMDGLVALSEVHDIKPDDVEAIEIGLPEMGRKIIGEPLEAKINPECIVDGQFSMPFCAAVVMREGQMGWDDYAKHISDDETLALCRKIKTVPDDQAEAAFPANMSGSVKIKTSSGEFETFVEVPKGEPDNFMSATEFRAKFDGLCAPYLDDARRDRLADALLSLETANNVGDVFALCQPGNA
ncbi:MAG: MmgE/PrpD family protein [Rhodospirillaceae bacterium]|nr:MmgE/PrpD family protein [Rhodospirillaceae bacterium]MBT3909287.1 MmgE/PrpD family protein [Rhodospirillaceae bacterium]MBT5516113.1 MmgE/PrpD family protein [Rhodospirillaceae bacterium]MBT6087265.1 MmgE/PrpD family protein [Rhodospirillaceae bacterium]MBT6607530.1 MmgE/PrpD family protein [Rhodospirillaceae bacterium]